MILKHTNVQTPSTIQTSRNTSRRGVTPENYRHFKRILKTRQKFPTGTDGRTTPDDQLQPIKTSTPLKYRNSTQNFNWQDPHPLRQPKVKVRDANFYSLYSLPYKNYKYERPPGMINVDQYLEATLKLGQKIGKWDKQLLNQRLILENINFKRSNYSSDHLQRCRKPQGPASCLETIYLAKLQADEKQTPEQQQKVRLLEECLKSDLTLDQYKFPSQAYQLNKWTRQSNEDRQSCTKAELIPKFQLQRQHLESDITCIQKSIENVKTSMVEQSTIAELPLQATFFKFDPKMNSCKQIYLYKGTTVALLQLHFPIFKAPIIGDRLMLGLQLSPQQPDMKVGYKTFEKFYTTIVSKKGSLSVMIECMLQFFNPESDEIITGREFCSLLRIMCDQFAQKHPNVQDIYEHLLQNFKLGKVVTDLDVAIDCDQFRGLFTSQQMPIFDLIDLINN